MWELFRKSWNNCRRKLYLIHKIQINEFKSIIFNIFLYSCYFIARYYFLLRSYWKYIMWHILCIRAQMFFCVFNYSVTWKTCFSNSCLPILTVNTYLPIGSRRSNVQQFIMYLPFSNVGLVYVMVWSFLFGDDTTFAFSIELLNSLWAWALKVSLTVAFLTKFPVATQHTFSVLLEREVSFLFK